MCKILLNESLNGVELYFDGKPSTEVLTDLKSNGYRWNNKKSCWYAKQNENTLKVAEVYGNKEVETTIHKREKKVNIIDLFSILNGELPAKNTGLGKYDYKEVAKEIRTTLKKVFPFVKFSIRTKNSSINCDIVASPFDKDSSILNDIQSYCVKFFRMYQECTCYDPYGDYGSSYNFYGGYFQIDYDYKQTELTEEIKEMQSIYNLKVAELEEQKRIKEEQEWQEYLEQEKIKKAEAEQERINRFFKMETNKLSIEQSERELKKIEIIINENINNEELRHKLRDVENNIKFNYSSRLEMVNSGEAVEITISGEGLNEWGILSTFDIKEATEEFNKRIKYVYDNCCGYLKTFVTIKGKDFETEQRYDIDQTTDTISNLFDFMAEDKQQELNYMESNGHKMTWIKDIEHEKQIKKNLIELFQSLASENNCNVIENHSQRNSDIEKFNDTDLYILDRINNNLVFEDDRVVKNEYCVIYGKDLKDMIQEGKRIFIKSIEPYNGDIKHFIEELKKIAEGKIFSLFPTEEDIKLKKLNMCNRFINNRNRILSYS